MQHHYYIGEGPEAEALIAEVAKKISAVDAARKALRDGYGADNLFGRGGKVEGLLFETKQSVPFLKGGMRMDDGYGYYPKLNCMAGKELASKLDDPAMTFSASNYIVGTLKVARMVARRHVASRTGMALYYSVAGIMDGKILVSIPGDEGEGEDGGDPMPSVPAWLREVKESEWLAAQGR